MKRPLHILCHAFWLVFLSASAANAQNHIYPGDYVVDSSIFTFESGDSLSHPFLGPVNLYIDTSGTTLWEIGNSAKPFFSVGNSTRSIMTDTANTYPVNANDWFILKIMFHGINPIVFFKHKYQTSAKHDGGIVEFSFDGGANWQNAKGPCNTDAMPFGQGILTNNFYDKNDTLLTGEPAFNGTDSNWRTSAIQFFCCIPAKGTGVGCYSFDSIYIRFRFVSDSIVDTLDGWIIDDIKVRQDEYSGKVTSVQRTSQLELFPNPVYEGEVNFPELPDEQDLHISIYNSVGANVLKSGYRHRLNTGKYPPGLYFYLVTGKNQYYSGQLMIK